MATQTLTGGAARESAGGRAKIAATTLRRDAWWGQPLFTVVVLGAFVAYSTYAAFSGIDFLYNKDVPLISPFYSPCISSITCHGHADLNLFQMPWSAALIILPFPLAFRTTCYYYRKAYYRSFYGAPPACAVAEPHKRYSGESRFPLILQNTHRIWLYFAIIFAGYNLWIGVDAFHARDGWGAMTVGTLVLLINGILLTGYTLGCHSCRHITAGRLNNFSKHPIRYRIWTWVSKLNNHHMKWAWASLVWVAVADLYIRLLAAGVISHDPRFF